VNISEDPFFRTAKEGIFPGMKDAEVLEFLAEKLGSSAAAARAAGVSAQNYSDWKVRGISSTRRAVVWVLANAQGAELPESWLLKPGGHRRRKLAT
jgi:hypothetical protein